MIGFYNYSVIVTYIGVALSVSGMALASTGQFKFAILCLALSGACDTFDGKIARAMKNRTKEMEIFGIQIDSRHGVLWSNSGYHFLSDGSEFCLGYCN